MRICMYGAASTEISEIYIKAIRKFARQLAQRGHSLVFGAGDGGLMGAAARGFHDAGGHIMGVAPTFFKETTIEKLYEKSDVIVYTESMGMRKSVMESNADAFVVMPGGIGTYDEFFQILTLKQLKVMNQPIALYNINHFYDPIDTLLKKGMDEKFLRADTPSLCRAFTEDQTDEMIQYLETVPQEQSDIVTNKYGN